MEFQVNGKTYRAERLSAEAAFDLTLDLAPLLAGLVTGGALKAAADQTDKAAQFEAVAAAIMGAVGDLPKPKARAVMYGLLMATRRRMDNGVGWSNVAIEASPGVYKLMHEDISVVDMFLLAKHAFQVNLSSFTPALSRILPAGLQAQSAP